MASKKPRVMQKFNRNWMEDYSFMAWLRPSNKGKYENECEIDDDSDSNIGSMVSLNSRETIEEDQEEEENEELIVPEMLAPPVDVNVPIKIKTEPKPNQTDSWPTLEILPGGVIKNVAECEELSPKTEKSKAPVPGEMMYACAKCSQEFKYLFCLVKHVKWHEDQNKMIMNAPPPHIKKLKRMSPEQYMCLHSRGKKPMLPDTKRVKRKQPKRLKS